MKKNTFIRLSLVALITSSVVLLTGCETMQARVLDSSANQSAVQLRAMQSRAFETTDRQKTMRTVIATLQDLSFVIDKADMELGSISATKLDGYALRMTVSVRPHSEKRVVVRANAQFNIQPVTEPKPYQDFFTALEKAMFLTAQAVE